MDISDIRDRLARIKAEELFRSLPDSNEDTGFVNDFSGNDYLGISQLSDLRTSWLAEVDALQLPTGSGGSRLLAGNHRLWPELEEIIATDFHAEAGLFFSSGFAANQGLLATVPGRGDLVLFDERVHASIRQGLRLCLAKTLKFRHNDFEHAQALIERWKGNGNSAVYLIGESVYSMKGIGMEYAGLKQLMERHAIRLIVDEAHTTGLWAFGKQGAAPHFLQDIPVFARIVCFGKAYAAQGAMILGSSELKELLVNTCKEFIYTTASTPWLAKLIANVHQYIQTNGQVQEALSLRLAQFGKEAELLGFSFPGNHPIQFFAHPNPVQAREALRKSGFKVSAIRPPTVPKGEGGLRISVSNLVNYEACKQLVHTLRGL